MGYRKMIILSLFLLLPSVSLAQESISSKAPSPEMLDFLGSFDDEENGWIDPFELLAMDEGDFPQANEQDSGDEK